MTGSWLSPTRPRAAMVEVGNVRELTARINLYNSLQPANAEPVIVDAINVDPWGGPAHVRLTGADTDLARWLEDFPGWWSR